MRWSDYVLARGEEVLATWGEAAADKRTLYLLGEGFDPRALLGLERFLHAGIAAGELEVMSVALAPPGGSSERAATAAANVEHVAGLAEQHGFEYTRLPYPTSLHEQRSAGRLLFQALYGTSSFAQAGHIIIDISALPTGIYFALIAGVLHAERAEKFSGELQVVVGENPELDSLIRGEGAETPTTIGGFKFDVELDPRADRPVIVWAPVLGEESLPQLEALHRSLAADEVCPVLPFPATNPRRADNLLLGLREFFESAEIEPPNCIYAHESNPFDLYRGLSGLHARYRDALQPVGDAALVLSVHSSKTLSLGALLAAYESRLPVMNAEPEHYQFDTASASEELIASTSLACLWLAGTPGSTSA